MDRRQQKTRQAVFDAFALLLERKNYTNITIQDIIDEANIGRSTFYAHFETKDELLKVLCSEIFDHVFAEKKKKKKTHDFSENGNNIKAEITHILYHLQEHMDYLPGILSGESGDIFMSFFMGHLRELFSHARGSGTAVPRDYILNHMVCDFAETVRWWARNTAYTPEQISAFFFETTPLLE